MNINYDHIELYCYIEGNKFNLEKLVKIASPRVVHLFVNKFGVNYKDKNKRTLLFFAIKEEDFELTKYLLSKNIDINSKDKFGQTALHTAAKLGNCMLYDYLIKHNANVEIKDNFGKTAKDYLESYFSAMIDFLNSSAPMKEKLNLFKKISNSSYVNKLKDKLEDPFLREVLSPNYPKAFPSKVPYKKNSRIREKNKLI